MDFKKKNILRLSPVEPFQMMLSYVEVTRDSPENEYDSHVHPECEIYVNLTGDVSFMVEKRIYPILPGSIVITRPYEYHHCIYHSNDLHKHFWILFSSAGNEALLPRFFDRKKGENNLLLLSAEAQKELVALCHSMIDSPSHEGEKQYRFWQLMHLLESADVAQPSLDSYSSDVAFALDYINQNFASPILISNIAAAAHVSINTFERHFSDALHMSPSAYLKKKRLAHAAALLYEGSSVMEACQNSGFSDYSNFIALFKHAYGTTPLKYKNEQTGTFEKKK